MNAILAAERDQRWSVYDNVGNAIYRFKRSQDETRPWIYVLYRNGGAFASSFNNGGESVHVIRTKEVEHDNELYAFLPGEQVLLAFWANGKLAPEVVRFPIRIASLQEARMVPIEIIYDENGEEAGWKRTREEEPKLEPGEERVKLGGEGDGAPIKIEGVAQVEGDAQPKPAPKPKATRKPKPAATKEH